MRYRGIASFSSLMFAGLFLIAGLMGAAEAEVIDIEGTVVGVSLDDRTISLERQTAKGKKRIDLEVARKAGDLASIDVGDRVFVSYDPALEIVTRISSDGAPLQSAETVRESKEQPAGKVSRVTVELSSRGVLVFRLEPSADAPYAKPTGSAAQLSGLKGARVINDDGFHFVDVECDDEQAIGVLGREGLDLRRGSLVADTSVARDQIGQRAFVRIERQFRLPFTLQMDTTRQGMGQRQAPSHGDCSLNFNFAISSIDGLDVGHVFITVQPLDPFLNSGKVFFSLREPNQQMRQVAERDIRDGKAECRLQVPGVSSQSKLSWWCVVRGEPAQIERVRAAGAIMPYIGVQLEGEAGRVVVKQVFQDGPAKRAGIADGEVIVSVNGEKVRDAESAVALIAEAKLGDELTLEIKKGDKSRKVALRAD